ncbi:MAG: adenylyltransferase/cytidyltransferase family protein [Verrucomicrobia bacterium]|nr:adenylyltransferase/cytidyltransferase family protein [Verrucomicrobiota bacterium]
MNFCNKIVSFAKLADWRRCFQNEGKRLVVTNGCFDLLHIGHVTYLEAARNQGDALLVGVNGDSAVRDLKGPARPINTEADRAAVLAALESVNGVCVFAEARAVQFLKLARPDIYVKGGDYTLDTLDSEERLAVENCGGRIVIIPMVPGKSTTQLVQRLASIRDP